MCAVIEKYYGEDLETARKEARAQGKAEGKAEGKTEGRTDAIIELITAGLLTLSQGAVQLNISEDKMREMVAAVQ